MKYLGVDFGLRRIGLSISEGELASPWKVIEVKSLADAVEKIADIIKDGSFDKVVVGMPEGKLSKTVFGFIKRLKQENFDAETFEETLSTKQAIQSMIATGIPKEKRKVNDAVAAAIILQNWLDNARSEN